MLFIIGFGRVGARDVSVVRWGAGVSAACVRAWWNSARDVAVGCVFGRIGKNVVLMM